MSSGSAVTIPGYADVHDAAAKLGVAISALRNHLRNHGDVSRLERYAAAIADPRGIEMPDGSRVATVDAACQQLGIQKSTVYSHLCRFGHLRGAGLMDRGRADRPISLVAVPGVEVGGADPRPETAPRGSHMVSAGALDVDAVIATIRQCRDAVLAEREGAA